MTFGVPSGRTEGVNIPDKGSASPEYALFYNESLSTPFIIKMGIVLLLLIVSVILLIRDIKRREIG